MVVIVRMVFAMSDRPPRTGLSNGVVTLRPWSEADAPAIVECVDGRARGRGLATRALVLTARWALGHEDVARVQLRADVENEASRRVAEKAGFRLEGVLRAAHWSPRQQRRLDWAMYSLLPGELE
jgi:RimJ/RimL family protein N-acetyltransferase